MKIFKLILFVAILGQISCSNDLNLTTDWRPIPVVFGFLNKSDTAQYLRIQKAFLDPNSSALTVAKIPDSLYFDNVTVSLIRLSNNKVFELSRVIGADEGFPKVPGTFATDPNYLYKIKTSKIDLIDGEKYRLEIRRNDATSSLIGSSETDLVGTYEMVTSDPNSPMALPYKSDVRVSWKSAEKVAKLYNVKMIMNYLENSEANPTAFLPKKLVWQIGENIERPLDLSSRITATFQGEEFFRFLQNNLILNQNIKRSFQTAEFEVTAGGPEFSEYLSLLNASLGITSSQIVPNYTNVTNGVGIFSSRSKLVKSNYALSIVARDSLKNGIYTKKLNFQ